MKHCIECHKLFSPRDGRQIMCSKKCATRRALKFQRVRRSDSPFERQRLTISNDLPPLPQGQREEMLERFLSYILTPQEQVQVIFQDAQSLGQHYHRGEMA